MKNKIIDAATILFNEQGYFQTSMDDIASHANVAKGSLYYHFKSKAELFTEAVIDGLNYLEGVIQEIINADGEATVVAYEIIKALVSLYGTNRPLVDIVMNSSHTVTEGALIEKIEKAKRNLIQQIASAITMGKNDEALRNCNSEIVASAMISYIYTFATECYAQGTMDANEIAEAIQTLLMKGLLRIG